MPSFLFTRKRDPFIKRRLAAGAIILVFWVLMIVLIQPAEARSPGAGLLAPGDTETPTATETATVTATVTTTVTATVTITETITASPTITPTHAAHIVINEVAWMGNKGTGFNTDEWIELYNPIDAPPVDFSTGEGWKLRTKDGSLTIALVGTVEPGGFFLIERGDGNAIKDSVSKETIIPDQVYSGAQLPDGGSALTLVDGAGYSVDSANDNGGVWPAGSALSRCTMERRRADVPDSDTAWFTNNNIIANGLSRDAISKICGTPRQPNWAYSVIATSTFTPSPTRTITPTRTNTPRGYKTPTRTPTPNRTVPSSIVINEFLTQPRFDWNGDGKTDQGDEYIELVNLSSLPISISGWRLDDQDGDSSPFLISGSIIMQPKTHMVFFTSETGILLSNGGDSVRLYKNNGQISDAYTYGVVETPDQSWCRLPDGSPAWIFGCAPTVGSANRPAESILVGNRVESALCLAKNIPLGVLLAECDPRGLGAWDPSFWDLPPLDFPRFINVDTHIYILQ